MYVDQLDVEYYKTNYENIYRLNEIDNKLFVAFVRGRGVFPGSLSIHLKGLDNDAALLTKLAQKPWTKAGDLIALCNSWRCSKKYWSLFKKHIKFFMDNELGPEELWISKPGTQITPIHIATFIADTYTKLGRTAKCSFVITSGDGSYYTYKYPINDDRWMFNSRGERIESAAFSKICTRRNEFRPLPSNVKLNEDDSLSLLNALVKESLNINQLIHLV